MKIPTQQIPQADSLEVVERALEAVSEGAKTYQEIASSLGYDERQGRYYRLACEILGFTERPEGENSSVITSDGQLYLDADVDNKMELLRNAILNNVLFQRIIPYFESKVSGLTKHDVEEFLSQLTETTPVMVGRRASTILSWLRHADLIQENNGRYVRNLDIRSPIIKYNDITEPLLPTEFEMTEYTKIADRVKEYTNNTTYEIERIKQDRANDIHNDLTNLLADKICQSGGVPKSNVLVDLAAQVSNERFIFEVKSTTEDNMRKQIRRGVSQLYEYRYLQNVPKAKLVLVLEKPLSHNLEWVQDYLINDRCIYLVWDGDGKFHCSDKLREKLSFLLD
ncbi:AAA-associated domain-containing protein [bacterium]|nr:AAA-associated domain-containing protein [bacterium]